MLRKRNIMKILQPLSVLATITILAFATTAGAQAMDPQIPRTFDLPLPLFDAPGSAWLQNASSAGLHPDNSQQILVTYRVMCGDTTNLYPLGDPPTMDQPYADITYEEYTLPIFEAGTGTQAVLLCDYEGTKEYPNAKWGVDTLGGPITVPACAGQIRPSSPADLDSDGHMILYNPANSTAYDFWQVSTELISGVECQSAGGGIIGTEILEAGYADFFEIHGDGTNPDGMASARAMGTPLLAGMIVPEDVESGAISHALTVAIPGPRNTSPVPSEPPPSQYFYPASTTETDYYSINPYALAGGQRIRMTNTIVDENGAVIDEDSLAPITRMWITALRTYGAYVLDNASGFTFYAEDYHTANLNLSDAEVNVLIGQAPGAALDPTKTKWQIVLETIDDDIWSTSIPFAHGVCSGATSSVTIANFEVVENAAQGTTEIFGDNFESGNTDEWSQAVPNPG